MAGVCYHDRDLTFFAVCPVPSSLSMLLNMANFAPWDPHILQKAKALTQALACYLVGWDTSHPDCQEAATPPDKTTSVVQLDNQTNNCVPTYNECNAIGAKCCDAAATCFSGIHFNKCHYQPGEECHCLLAPKCSPPCAPHGSTWQF